MFTLPKLPYTFDALEPYIDTSTMEIHYTKHHQTYVDKLNAALERYPDLQNQTVEQLLARLADLPGEVRTAVKNHGGGHYNHSLFWTSMMKGGSQPSEALSEQLSKTFGSIDAFRDKFSAEAIGRFGSGWAWLVKRAHGELAVLSTANQDCPLSDGHTPLLGIDVWEHAYYLKHQNRRPDYIAAWWNVVNWQEVEHRLGSFTPKV